MTPKLIVFDWDGTLIDSISTIIGCTLETFAHLGLEAPTEARVRSAIGLGLRESVEHFYPGIDDALYGRVLATYRELWIGDYTARSELFEGVVPMLKSLKAKGHLLAIATAKSRVGLEREARRTGVIELFDATRTVDECPPKPDPGMLDTLAQEFDLEAGDLLMIGDTLWDLEMARNAGVPAVAVTTGAQDASQLALADPRACLSSVTEIPAWLENGFQRLQGTTS